MSTVILVFFGDLTIYLPIIGVASARELLRYVYVGATMSDKSDDKSELPFENHGSSLLLPLLSLIVAPT
jgi:hypothetical protein